MQRYDKDDEALDILEQRQLLFPCYHFDHAEGFARATRFLVYHVSGHIQEDNPIEHDELHLPVFTTRESLTDHRLPVPITFSLTAGRSAELRQVPPRLDSLP